MSSSCAHKAAAEPGRVTMSPSLRGVKRQALPAQVSTQFSDFYSCSAFFQAGSTKILQNPTLVAQAKPSNSALPSLFEWFEGSHPKHLNIMKSAAAVTVSLLDFYSLDPETFPSS